MKAIAVLAILGLSMLKKGSFVSSLILYDLFGMGIYALKQDHKHGGNSYCWEVNRWDAAFLSMG